MLCPPAMSNLPYIIRSLCRSLVWFHAAACHAGKEVERLRGPHIELCGEAVTVVRSKAPGGLYVEVGLKAVHKGADAVPCSHPQKNEMPTQTMIPESVHDMDIFAKAAWESCHKRFTSRTGAQ